MLEGTTSASAIRVLSAIALTLGVAGCPLTDDYHVTSSASGLGGSTQQSTGGSGAGLEPSAGDGGMGLQAGGDAGSSGESSVGGAGNAGEAASAGAAGDTTIGGSAGESGAGGATAGTAGTIGTAGASGGNCSPLTCAGKCCDDQCVDSTKDNNNCGRCGKTCEGGTTCVASFCVK
jgi:hypothetical protein